MKNWSYGINSLYKSGTLILEESAWYIFAIERGVEWICDHTPAIPLPSIPIKDCDGEETTLKDYYGDTQQLFCSEVHIPIYQWAQDKKQIVFMESSYDILREKFYDKDKKFFDDEEKIGEE